MFKMFSKNLLAMSLAAIGLGFGASTAEAGFTSVRGASNGEDSHRQIFSNVYGGTFMSQGSGPQDSRGVNVDFSNGDIYARRVDDNDDQLWDLESFSARALARFASYRQALRFRSGSSGAGERILAVGDNERAYNVTGNARGVEARPRPFRFLRTGDGEAVSSVQSDNTANLDRMVTYRIEGLDTNEIVYALFFEDLLGAARDEDFNDLVVEIRVPVSMPLPSAALGGMMLMGSLGGMRVLRRPSRKD